MTPLIFYLFKYFTYIYTLFSHTYFYLHNIIRYLNVGYDFRDYVLCLHYDYVYSVWWVHRILFIVFFLYSLFINCCVRIH